MRANTDPRVALAYPVGCIAVILFWDDDEVVAACRCELVGQGFGKETQRRSKTGS